MTRITFGALPCRVGEGLDDSSRLDVVEIARVPDMLSSLFSSWLVYGFISTPVRNERLRKRRTGKRSMGKGKIGRK